MSASRSPVNALHWIGGAAAFAATIWWWNDFSGPFRGLVDLQVRLTGRFYWEPLAVAVLLTGLLFGVVVVAGVLNPIVPRFGEKTWGWLLLAAALLASGGALWWAWHQWTSPAGPTRQNPLLRVLDLDRLETPSVSFGPVRIIGRADRRDMVKLRREPRGSYVYQPLSGRHRAARDMPIPVIAVCYDRYGRNCMPEALEGWLYPGDFGEGERESYRLRRAGVVRTQPFYMLRPGLPRGDSYVETSDRDRGGAVATVLGLVAIWFVIIFTWIKAPPSAFPAKPAERSEPPVSAPEDNPYLLPLIAGGFAFVFLSFIGVISWVIHLISAITP